MVYWWFTDGLPMVWWYDLTKKKAMLRQRFTAKPQRFQLGRLGRWAVPLFAAVMSAVVVNMLDTWVWRTLENPQILLLAIHPHLYLHYIKTSQTGCPKLRVTSKIAGIDEWMNGSVSPPWCILRFDEKIDIGYSITAIQYSEIAMQIWKPNKTNKHSSHGI